MPHSSRICQTTPCRIPGFECYVSETFEAPESVMTHLCKEKHLNKVPIFREDTPASSLTEIARSGFIKYFIGKDMHTVRNLSRFGLANSDSVEDCTHERTTHTTCISDDDQLQRVEEEDAEAKVEQQRISERLQRAGERLTQAAETCKRCEADLGAVQAKFRDRAKLKTELLEKMTSKNSLATGDPVEHRVAIQ